MAVDLSTLPDLRPQQMPAVLAEGLDVVPCTVTVAGAERPAVAVSVITQDGRISAPFLFVPGFDWQGFADSASAAAEQLAVPVELVPPPRPPKVTCPSCGVAIFGDRAAAGICGACE